MKTYTFTNGSEKFTTEASSYDHALDLLIAHCGSEEAAAVWIYRGD